MWHNWEYTVVCIKLFWQRNIEIESNQAFQTNFHWQKEGDMKTQDKGHHKVLPHNEKNNGIFIYYLQ
jgi:hypothetical protein